MSDADSAAAAAFSDDSVFGSGASEDDVLSYYSKWGSDTSVSDSAVSGMPVWALQLHNGILDNMNMPNQGVPRFVPYPVRANTLQMMWLRPTIWVA